MNCSFCRVFGTRLILLLCGHCSPLTRQPTPPPPPSLSLATSFFGNLRAFFVLLLSRLSPHASLSGTEGRMEKRVENDEAMINEAASLCPSACTQHADVRAAIKSGEARLLIHRVNTCRQNVFLLPSSPSLMTD